MTVDQLHVLVEEESMEQLLRGVIPKIKPGLPTEFHVHQGKAHLLRKLPDRLRGYARWLPRSARVLVVVDADDDDCSQLKARVDQAALDAGLAVKSSTPRAWQVATRIAVEELEAWYFGDWAAVCAAYPKAPAALTSRSAYRKPDGVKGGTWEAFERELVRAGCFPSLPKIKAAQAIGSAMNPGSNTSPSFQALRRLLMAL